MKDALRRNWLLLSSLVLALVSLACVAIPFYVIRPFRTQGTRELAIALFVQQVGPAVSTASALLAAVMVWSVWARSAGWLSRTTAALLAMLAAGGSYMSRVNIYELMFHPIGAPRFESADKASVDSDDLVMAVQEKNERRAYPIREMSYHHVVNDSLAGEPIVVTY
jgi:hypothetical protein